MSEVLDKKFSNFRRDIVEDFVEVSNTYFNNDRREAYIRSDNSYEYFLEFNPFNTSSKLAFDPYDYADADYLPNNALIVKVGSDFINNIFNEVLGDHANEALSLFYQTEVNGGNISNIDDHWIKDNLEEAYGQVGDPGGGNYDSGGISIEIVPGSDILVFTKGWEYYKGDPYVGEDSGYIVSDSLNEQDPSPILGDLAEYFKIFAEEIAEEL